MTVINIPLEEIKQLPEDDRKILRLFVRGCGRLGDGKWEARYPDKAAVWHIINDHKLPWRIEEATA